MTPEEKIKEVQEKMAGDPEYRCWLYRVIGEEREPESNTFTFNTIPVEGKIFSGEELIERINHGWGERADAITAVTDFKTGEIAGAPAKKLGRPFSKGKKK